MSGYLAAALYVWDIYVGNSVGIDTFRNKIQDLWFQNMDPCKHQWGSDPMFGVPQLSLSYRSCMRPKVVDKSVLEFNHGEILPFIVIYLDHCDIVVLAV